VEVLLLQRYVQVEVSSSLLLTRWQNFGLGFYEGIMDIVSKPHAGAKKEGGLGFMKGLGKGSMDSVTKPGSGECRHGLFALESLLRNDIAMFGLVAYPAQEIYKSIKSGRKNKITDTVRAGKIASFERLNVPKGISEWRV
jgi:sterol 3beta-glucosyltransferase